MLPIAQERGTSIPKEVVIQQVKDLIGRRRSLSGENPPYCPGVNLALEITNEFEALSQQTGVSVAALEFLVNPVGLVGKGVTNLTSAEQAIEDVNVELATELHNAGLL